MFSQKSQVSLFASEKMNAKRQPEFDLARTFNILSMVWVHVLAEWGNGYENVMTSFVYEVMGLPFCAPLFMFCMGASVLYSKKNSPADLLSRGIRLWGSGLMLNVFRYALPYALMWAYDVDIELSEFVTYLFHCDILQFAGMTFLFLALVRHLRWSNRTVLLIALATSAVSHFLNFRSTGNPLFDLLGGWLWYSNGDSWFPFLNWLLFPVSGYLFGGYLQRCTDKERLYRIITPVCLIPSVSYVLFCFVYRVGLYSHWSRTYGYEFIDAVFVAMLCIGQLGVFYFITTRLLAGKMEIFRGLGSNITIVYWWHYLFIKWSSAIMRILGMDHVWPFWLCTVVAIVILALSHCIAFSYRKVLSRYKLSF